MNIRVNLTRRVQLGGKDRYCPVVMSANGRVKPGWVIVDGKPEHFPSGTYYIDWTVQGKRERTAVGTDAAQAFARKLRKETELMAEARGIALVPQVELDKRRTLVQASATYPDEIS